MVICFEQCKHRSDKGIAKQWRDANTTQSSNQENSLKLFNRISNQIRDGWKRSHLGRRELQQNCNIKYWGMLVSYQQNGHEI